MKKKYASFIDRFAAAFIDCLIIGFAGSFISNTTWFSFVLILAYSTWMEGNYGATVGKMVLKLKVTKENGKKITYSDAFLRRLSSYLSGAVLLLGYFNVIWDEKKQSWHDKIAKTIVVKA